MDMLVLIHNTDGHSEPIPLLDTVKGKRTQTNSSTVLDQHDTEEYEGGNGGVY